MVEWADTVNEVETWSRNVSHPIHHNVVLEALLSINYNLHTHAA